MLIFQEVMSVLQYKQFVFCDKGLLRDQGRIQLSAKLELPAQSSECHQLIQSVSLWWRCEVLFKGTLWRFWLCLYYMLK